MEKTRGGLVPATLTPKLPRSQGSPYGTELKDDRVPCLFNPYEYSVSKSNTYDPGKTKGRNIPRARFQQGGAMVLKLNLVFDTYGETEEGDGRPVDVTKKHTHKIWKMMMIHPKTINPNTQKGYPPNCVFRWGPYEFEGVITQMTETLTVFDKEGVPVRSKIQMSLQQIVDRGGFPGKQNPTSGGGIAPTTRVLYAGDRLDLIAWEEYGDCSKWRLIAEANEWVDPLHMRPGQTLIVPPLET